jgi:SAM-dependent methyltransferase
MSVAKGFDAVFSNAALHWMSRPDLVIAGVWRALRPGGRFVGELGGKGCVARIRAALLDALARRGIDGREVDPWYFPSAEEYRARLARGGFRLASIELFPRPTPLPGDIEGWLETFAGSFLSLVPRSEVPALLAEVRERLREEICDERGRWIADYVRLRFDARKPLADERRSRDP